MTCCSSPQAEQSKGQPALDKLTPWEDRSNRVCGYEASMSKRHPHSKGALLVMAVPQKQEEGFLGQVRVQL